MDTCQVEEITCAEGATWKRSGAHETHLFTALVAGRSVNGEEGVKCRLRPIFEDP